MAVVADDNRYGYIDSTGKTVVNTELLNAYAFSDGRGRFGVLGALERVFGYYDKDGQIAIEAQYSEARDFSEGYAAVKGVNGKWGYIDSDGNTVIPFDFDTAYDFVNGYARVEIKGKTGFIKKGFGD